MAEITFLSLYESNQEELKAKLENLSLPKDRQKIQDIVGRYLEDMFNEEGEMRQNLTESEDYMLQAALTLLNAEQKMVNQISAQCTTGTTTINIPVDNLEKAQFNEAKSLKHTNVLAGTVIGGVGGAFFGSWAAVFGAIAGTALVLYVSANAQQKNPKTHVKSELKSETVKVAVDETPLNVSAFMSIIKEICASIDTIISTYRSQIARVVNKYESQSKPSIEVEHRSLLECIQSVIGYVECHSPEEANFEKKLSQRIEDLSEMLDSYGIEVVAYDGENGRFFDEVESKQVKEPKMTVPAFVKNSKAILKGKILIPIE